MLMPPGPNLPPALQMFRWIRDPFSVMEECHSRFGDAFTLRIPGFASGLVLLSDPDVAKEVFALGAGESHAGKGNLVLKPFLGAHSLMLLDGAEHLRQRKMILPAFHGERMHAYGRTMMDVAHTTMDGWPLGKKFAVHPPMQAITIKVIIRTVFGVAEGPRFAELADVLTRTLEAATWPGLLFRFMQKDIGRLSPWGRFVRLVTRAGEILRDEIRQAQEKGTAGRTDVLAMMLDARDEAGRALSEDELHDQLLTLLVAGHETTATSLAWTLRWLLPDGSLVSRLRAEIATADEEPQRVAKLQLLDATVREALRLEPVIPMVSRVLQRATRIGRFDFAAGTAVAPAIYLVNRRASLYPEPRRFRPDRFATFKPAAWEWLPFGGGLRRCIAANFAIYEMKMVLASLLPRIDARLAASDIRYVRRSITVAPSDGLPIIVTANRPRASRAKAA
jgi:cytochrome P450